MIGEMLEELTGILEELGEDNPWHDKLGRFAKGGIKTAVMWSLYGKRFYIKKKKKGGKTKIFKIPARRKGWI